MGGVPYLQANFTEEIYQSCQKHMSLSLHLFVPIGHYVTGVKLNLCTAEPDGAIDNNNISWHTQDTTALRPIMILTEKHQILVIKNLSLRLMYFMQVFLMFTGHNNVTSNMFLFSQLGTLALNNFPETFKDEANILRDAWLPTVCFPPHTFPQC